MSQDPGLAEQERLAELDAMIAFQRARVAYSPIARWALPRLEGLRSRLFPQEDQ